MSPSLDKRAAVRIGCVPEHFSGPLYLGLEKDEFLEENLDVSLHNCLGGTGQMIKMLEENLIDVGVTLTEGTVLKAVNDQLANLSDPLRIAGSYTNSHLNWGISISPSSNMTSTGDLKNARIGVSRLGSGSHIMAIVFALQQGWIVDNSSPFEFVVLNDINGLLKGIADNICDAFLWEVITTKPYTDKGLVKCLDTVVAPWDAFVLASKHDHHPHSLNKAITKSIDLFTSTFDEAGLPMLLNRSEIFHYPNAEDVRIWFQNVKFTYESRLVSKKMLLSCIDILTKAKLIDHVQLKDWESKSGTTMVDAICHPSIGLED